MPGVRFSLRIIRCGPSIVHLVAIDLFAWVTAPYGHGSEEKPLPTCDRGGVMLFAPVRSHNSTHAGRAVAAFPTSGSAVPTDRAAAAHLRGTLQADDRRGAARQDGIRSRAGRRKRRRQHGMYGQHRRGGEEISGWPHGCADGWTAAL